MANDTFPLSTPELNQPEKYLENLEENFSHSIDSNHSHCNYNADLNLDDTAIIQKFIEGQISAIANQNLRIVDNDTEIQLITNKLEVISVHTCSSKISSVSIKVGSKYGDLLHQILIKNNFVLFGKSKQKGFIEYQQYIPLDGYKVNCTEATVLWRNWLLNKKHDNHQNIDTNILIFTGNEWSEIEDILNKDNRLCIKTKTGALSIDCTDKTIWSTQVLKKSISSNRSGSTQDSQELQLDTNNFDDIALIENFADGNKQTIINENFNLFVISNTLQLSTKNSEVISILTCQDSFRSVLLKINSAHTRLIHKILIKKNFIALGESQKKGFLEYKYYPLPNSYKINNTEAALLWKTWWPNQHHHNKHQLKFNILLFTRNNWYPIQNISIGEGKVYIKTLVGEVGLPINNKLTWAINSTPQVIPVVKQSIPASQTEATTHTSKPEISTESTKITQVSSNIPAAKSNLNSNVNLQADAQVIPKDLLAKQKARAIQILNDYLVNGETEVITEVVKNSQGEVISTKTFTCKKPCPQWVIEFFLKG